MLFMNNDLICYAVFKVLVQEEWNPSTPYWVNISLSNVKIRSLKSEREEERRGKCVVINPQRSLTWQRRKGSKEIY